MEQQASANEFRSLERFLLSQAPDLLGFVAARIPVGYRSLIAAEDVVQEIWITAFRHIDAFRRTEPNACRSWLLTIATSRVADALKRARRIKRGGRHKIMNAADDSSQTAMACVSPARQRTPSRDASLHEAMDAIQTALVGLPAEQRCVIRMHYLEQRPFAEIAKAIDRSETAARSLKSRALGKLEKSLGDASKYLSGDGPQGRLK